MTKPTTEFRFRRMLAQMRERSPALLPVRVYRRALEDCLGYTSLIFDKDGRPKHFQIVICWPMSWPAVWQVLVHEWAHAVAWREGHETVCDHDPEWGLALSRLYQEHIDF